MRPTGLSVTSVEKPAMYHWFSGKLGGVGAADTGWMGMHWAVMGFSFKGVGRGSQVKHKGWRLRAGTARREEPVVRAFGIHQAGVAVVGCSLQHGGHAGAAHAGLAR